ncbi:MAG: pseudouridine synthase [Candidatus Omnitrophica bacterium]|nr:pseudouridine synthase [Candidatus Omnitrophota bacterium]
MILAFHKPYGVLSRFTGPSRAAIEKEGPSGPPLRTLADFGFPKKVYSVGRLDADSEGLLLLSDEKEWNDKLLNPRHAHERTYHVQVEGLVTEVALEKLCKGLIIQGHRTRPCRGEILKAPRYPPRQPPIRFRLSVPTSWIELKLTEGKNRQVRRMTAAVGFPTLRLIRTAIGGYALGDLPAGKWRVLTAPEKQSLLR